MSGRRRLLQSVRVVNFYSTNYIEYESNGDRNKTLQMKEYLNEARSYSVDNNN